MCPFNKWDLLQSMTGTDHCHVECMYGWDLILNPGRALARKSGVARGQVVMT